MATDTDDDTYEDDDVDTDSVDAEDEDADDEIDAEADSETKETEGSLKSESTNVITELRKQGKQEKLFQDGLLALAASSDLKVDSIEAMSITDIFGFLKMMPALQEVIKMAYMNWGALKKAKAWSDVNKEVLADIDLLMTTFHFTIPEQFIDWTIHAVLQLLDLTVPISVIQQNLKMEPGELRPPTLPEIMALAKDHNAVVLPEKVYRRLKSGKAEPEVVAPKKKKKNR